MKFADSDGFLDVIIYVILMVVGLAASAYRNFTKRKQAREGEEQGELFTDFPELDTEPVYDEETTYPENPFEQFIPEEHEITEPNQPAIPVPEVQSVSKESQLDRPVSEVEVLESKIDSIVDQLPVFTHEDSSIIENNLPSDISSGDLSRDEIHDPTEEEVVSETFDAKKAIIYSEIINLKYI